jgi:hypothetical protein
LFLLFAGGVNDTGGKFAIGINNTSGPGGKNLPPVSLTLVGKICRFAAGVVDTGGKFSTGVVDTGGAL